MLRLMRRARLPVCLLATILSQIGPSRANALTDTFGSHTKGSNAIVDHGAWTSLLQTYVRPAEAGLNRVDYAGFKSGRHGELKAYISALEKADVPTLGWAEQFAYWANLYNAKTIDIVLDKYPVKSIKEITLGGGLFASLTGGPWKAKVVKVNGIDLSLDDIEHGILRGIFKDPRVHYAVNCASIGCPNLGREAFVGAKLEAQLDSAARSYVNAPRGISVAAGSVTASSIYSWFQADFGGSSASVLEHVRRYADPGLKQKLAGVTAITDFTYDWSLNDAKN